MVRRQVAASASLGDAKARKCYLFRKAELPINKTAQGDSEGAADIEEAVQMLLQTHAPSL
jgi:hypothetical protein